MSVYHVPAWCLWRPGGCQSAWNWSYRWFWGTVWVLGIEPEFSARATSALNN